MLAGDSPLPNPYVNLDFPVIGSVVPLDHGYPLYGSICHRFPIIHDLTTLSVHPISGKPEFPHLLHLTENSRLSLRLPNDRVPLIYRLAGKTLTLNQYKIRLGLPESHFISPSRHLSARLVIIRGFDRPETFLEAAQHQLALRGIKASPRLISRPDGDPIRRTIAVKGKTLVGYGVEIDDLSPEDAISLQEKGIGGKHKMGCGVFVPVKRRPESI
jgi:CRISPR-associated protein Cas6